MPTGSYSASDIENVSLTNGNVNLGIPLASLPPIAGGKLGLTLRADYNSKLWDTVRIEHRSNPAISETNFVYAVSELQQSDSGGWRIGAGYSISFESVTWDYDFETPSTEDPNYNLITSSQWVKVILTTPDGAKHELRPLDYSAYAYSDPDGLHPYLRGYYPGSPHTLVTPVRYYSYDGSHLWARIQPNPLVETYPGSGVFFRPNLGEAQAWTIFLPDGTQIQQADGIQKVIDTNGNKIKIWTGVDSDGITGTHYEDELTGRHLRLLYNASANNNLGQYQVQYQTVGGIWQTIAINLGSTRVYGKRYYVGNAECPDIAGYVDVPLTVIRSIVYPATEPSQPGRQFTFAYNSDTVDPTDFQYQTVCFGSPITVNEASHGWGSLKQIVMPTGTTVNYVYGLDGEHFPNANDPPREALASKTVTHDGITEPPWLYSLGPASGGFTAPDGSFVEETRYTSDPGFAHSNAGFGGKEELVYRTNNSNKTLVERHWTLMRFTGADDMSAGHLVKVAFNPVVDAEYTSILDTNQNVVKMSAKTYQYDYNGNLRSETDYDWFDPSAQGCTVSRDDQGIPTGVPACATQLRTISNEYYNESNSDTSTNIYSRQSLSATSPLIQNALKRSVTGSAEVRLSYDSNNYGVAPTIGNLTAKSVYNDFESSWINSSMTYDSYGNVATVTDGRGNATTFAYDSCSHALPTAVTVDPENGTGTQTTTTAYDCPTGLVTSTTDVNGKTSTIDYINVLLNSVDPFGRPGITKSPAVTVNGSSQQQQHFVTTRYLDSTRQVIVAADLYAENDQLLKTRTTADMLGRSVLSEQTEDGTNYTIFSKKVYDSVNRIVYSTSPMRCTVQSGYNNCSSDPLQYVVSATTNSWTRVTSDVLGRPTEVATFGGATQPTATSTTGLTGTVSTAYDANFTTVTDQAGKVRRSMVDGLGRLIRVDEPNSSGSLGTTASPNQPTSYTYDVLGNLRTVTQDSGAQAARTFTYDSLSRLRTAFNPESGTVSYTYDENGNLLTKSDARSIVTTYAYDALNRVTSRDYSDSTPDVAYVYDTANNGKGRLRSVSSSVSSYTFSGYDEVGKVLAATQAIGSQSYSLSYVYDLAGHVTSILYPSNRTVNYNYDNAGRLADKDSSHLAFTGSLGDGLPRTYSKGIVYGPSGQMTQEQFGTSTALYTKLLFNSRGQLSEMRVGTASGTSGDSTWNRGKIINDYSDACSGVCDGANNNGNLLKQSVYVPNNESNTSATSWYQQYTYDSLNRLEKVHEYTGNTSLNWQQQYVYDRFGNRTIDQNSSNTFGDGIPKPNFSVITASNRLGVPSGQSGTMTYDSAGNLTVDTYKGGDTYSPDAVSRAYDAENRMTSETQASSYVAGTYSYDGDGRRVKRVVGGVETWQVYGIGGELIAEYAGNAAPSNPQKEYGYRNGQLLITAEVTATAAAIPLNLTAGPSDNTTSSNISLSWTGVEGASYYKVERKAAGGNFAPLGTPVTTAYKTDTSADPATAYLYRVCTSESNGDCTSEYSNIALGARFTFPTDATIVSMAEDPGGATPIKAAHITELRTMVIAVRSLAGISSTTWTHPNLAAGDLIYKEDVKDLRDNLNTALTTLGIRTANWEDAILAGAPNGTPIRATHIRQLRARATSGSGANACYKSIDQFVKDFYAGVLHRQPNSTELTQWTESLTTAQNEGQADLLEEAQALGQALFNSSEYGSPSDEQFITDQYTGYLHRQPNDPPDGNWNGYNFWLNQLNTHHSRAIILNASETSIEFQQHVSSLCVTSAGGGNIHWLVADQLGTPRIVFDQSGSLAKTSRHDYLPFGEELSDTIGLRSGLGYTDADGARQKFTSKERDHETGLDYFLARYYSSTQGRFTGVDIAGPDLSNPQSLNKYAYTLNNPLRYIDRKGLYEEDVHLQLTYALGMAAGFTATDAWNIALGDQGVDDDPNRSPMTVFGVEARRDYHFTTEGRRDELWGDFVSAAGAYTGPSNSNVSALDSLGTFLHAQQDSYSHSGYGPNLGHLSAGHAPDKTYNAPRRADRMAEDTYNRLTTAATVLYNNRKISFQYKPLEWKVISPLVQAFNRAMTPEEKQKALNQIKTLAQENLQRQAQEAIRKKEEEEKRKQRR